jgi:hypothetical protein
MELKPGAIAFAAGAAILLLSFSPHIRAAGQQEAVVVLNGMVTPLDHVAYREQEAYYLPVREILGKLGYQVSWDEAAGKIIAEKPGGHRLEITPGKSNAAVDSKQVALGQTVEMVGETAYMPASPVLELLGYTLETDVYRSKLYLASSVWQKILEAVAGGGNYRLEGVADVSGSSSQAKLYLDGELAFDGSWKNRAMDGSGKVYDQGRLVYEGALKANLPDGPGIRYDVSGDRYEGLFVAGVPQGKGRLFSGGKLLYEGEWKAGRMNGTGKLYSSEGKAVFEGLFQNGVRQGYGVLFDSATGKKVYEGNWVGDVRAGYGKSFNGEGKIEYAGSWRKDKRSGTGTLQRYGKVNFYGLDGTNVSDVQEVEVSYVTDVEYSDGLLIKQSPSDWMYRGTFTASGELNGQGEAGRITGTLLSEAGVLNRWVTYYKGDFQYGKMTGSGTFYTETGVPVYVGQVREGKRQGQGISYSLSTGQLEYSGSWSNDVQDGTGWAYTFDGTDGGTSAASFTLTEVTYAKGALSKSGNAYRVYGNTAGGKGTGKGAQYWIYDAANDKTLNSSGSYSSSKGMLVYEGDLNNGLRDGSGTEYLPDGGKYTGGFRNNERSGTGTLISSPFRYEGEFLNNRKSGQGKLYVGGVLVYEGQFRNDMKNGYGISYRSGGIKEYEGNFRDDKRNGIGSLYDYWGTSVVYRGEFKDGLTLTEYNALHP